MVTVLVASAIAAIVAVFISKLVTAGMSGAASSQRRQDIATLKMTLRENLDCLETFNVTGATALPIPCPAGPIVLRGKRPASGGQGPELAPGNQLGT